MLGAVVVVLLGAEAGTRLLSPVGPALLVADPEIGKRYVAGFEGRVFVDEAGRAVALRFNREGFRGPDRPRPKPPGTFRVAVIGDSMIAGVATAEGKTLVGRLETALAERRPEARVEVLNFGVSSSSTGQELALYRGLVSAYEPDLVLLALFVGNDFADNSGRLTRARRIYFDLDEGGVLRERGRPAAPGPLTLWLQRHSRFYVWQMRAFRMLRGAGRAAVGAIPPGLRVFEVPGDPDLTHAWTLLDRVLRQFKADVEADGSRFALVVVPCAEQVHEDLWANLASRAAAQGRTLDREQPGRRLSAIAHDEGIPLLDLTPAFREATGARPSGDTDASPFLLGRYHLSDAGNRIAADEVLRFLTSLYS